MNRIKVTATLSNGLEQILEIDEEVFFLLDIFGHLTPEIYAKFVCAELFLPLTNLFHAEAQGQK